MLNIIIALPVLAPPLRALHFSLRENFAQQLCPDQTLNPRKLGSMKTNHAGLLFEIKYARLGRANCVCDSVSVVISLYTLL